jgi:hypothetical protein
MTVKERLLQFIEKQGITKNQFIIKIGIANGFFNTNNGVNTDNLEKIFSFYPELNMDWIVTGRGSMTIKEVQSEGFLVSEEQAEYEPKMKTISSGFIKDKYAESYIKKFIIDTIEELAKNDKSIFGEFIRKNDEQSKSYVQKGSKMNEGTFDDDAPF